ncbi:hypothetical protein Bpfe_013640 [Biomphalaria pfeifferi]|uniref:C2 domain-containing protein n=1 Tax=Biomphalaria pfeifferi TaxID=112525 RepID=A0AAD8FAS6_BIOPF|nr:hypothetical protein Bpfe_013640 [Biomphalaria pfeifferi]
MADAAQFKSLGRKINRKQDHTGLLRYRQKTQDEVFLTVADKSRQNSCLSLTPSPTWEENLELEIPGNLLFSKSFFNLSTIP